MKRINLKSFLAKSLAIATTATALSPGVVLGKVSNSQPTEKDNLYENVNYDYLSSTVVPKGLSFYDDDIALNAFLNILKNYSKANINGSSSLGKAINVYKSLIDYDSRNALGVTPLDSYFQKINGINSLDDFIDVCVWLIQNGVNVLNIDYTYVNSEQVLQLRDFVLDIYYPNSYDANHKEYLKRLFGLMSSNNGNTDVEEAFVLERSVARFSNKNHYNEMQGTEYKKLLSNSKSGDFADKLSSTFKSKFGVGGNVKVEINDDLRCQLETIKSSNMNNIKNFLRASLLRYSAPYLTKTISSAWIAHKNYSGLTQDDVDTKILQASLGFDRLYGKGLSENVLDSDKRFVKDIFEKVRQCFLTDIDSLNLQSGSKLKSHMNSITLSYGVPIDLQQGVAFPEISDKTLLKNMLALNAFNTSVSIAKCNKGKFNLTQEKTYVLANVDSNMAYDSAYNCIIFCPLIFNSSRYNSKLPEKTKWLNMAFTIGHETGHSIDSRSVPNLAKKLSLSSSDVNALSEVFSPLSQQVSEYTINISGKAYHMNPTRVLFEVVADYYGAKIVIDLIKNDPQYDLKDFFESYAKMRRSIETDEKLKKIIEQELHPLNEFRVNNTLSNFEELYKYYGIGINDGMYTSEDKRANK